jgi:hypothetical protein
MSVIQRRRQERADIAAAMNGAAKGTANSSSAAAAAASSSARYDERVWQELSPLRRRLLQSTAVGHVGGLLLRKRREGSNTFGLSARLQVSAINRLQVGNIHRLQVSAINRLYCSSDTVAINTFL